MSGTGDALSPLDGRYGDRLAHLSAWFSERALMRARCEIELDWLEALGAAEVFPPLDAAEQGRVEALRRDFSSGDYDRIKVIEETTRHDVKACEIFLREKLELALPGALHFGLTSEDVNNLAYSTLLDGYRRAAQLPLLDRLLARLLDLAERWKAVPFPTRTHGQKASPSTAGKEVAVFLSRLVRLRRRLASFRFRGKLNGATGNWSAMIAAFPAFDWVALSRRFVEERGLEANVVTTQIEDHDAWAEYFNLVRSVNNVLIDLDRDFWLYLCLALLRAPARAGEVGSSTMPHKVNPIRFENSEGNLSLSNALLGELSNKLCCSRMQRDLSDSTVERNIGVALAHAHLAAEETLEGLLRVDLDADECRRQLEASPELLAEPIQTVLRAAGVEDAYDLLKELTRGKTVDAEALRVFVDRLAVGEDVKARLRSLDVTGYVGAATQVCELSIAEARREVQP
jgi:adenylosuccinate lyase